LGGADGPTAATELCSRDKGGRGAVREAPIARSALTRFPRPLGMAKPCPHFLRGLHHCAACRPCATRVLADWRRADKPPPMSAQGSHAPRSQLAVEHLQAANAVLALCAKTALAACSLRRRRSHSKDKALRTVSTWRRPSHSAWNGVAVPVFNRTQNTTKGRCVADTKRSDWRRRMAPLFASGAGGRSGTRPAALRRH
jgi:hypothetical protein